MATGYTREGEHPIKVRKVFYDEEGRRCEEEHVEIAITEDYYPPQIVSAKFWLMNRDPGRWRERFEADISARVDAEISDVMIERMAEAFGYGKSKDKSDAGA
jgi:hypothetical protein